MVWMRINSYLGGYEDKKITETAVELVEDKGYDVMVEHPCLAVFISQLQIK